MINFIALAKHRGNRFNPGIIVFSSIALLAVLMMLSSCAGSGKLGSEEESAGSGDMVAEGYAYLKELREEATRPPQKTAEEYVTPAFVSETELSRKYPGHHPLSDETLGSVLSKATVIGPRKFVETNDLDYYDFPTLDWSSERRLYKFDYYDYYQRTFYYDGDKTGAIGIVVRDIGDYDAWRIALDWDMLTKQKSDTATYVRELFHRFVGGKIKEVKVADQPLPLQWFVSRTESGDATGLYRAVFNNQLMLTVFARSAAVKEQEIVEFIPKAINWEVLKKIESMPKPE